MFDVYFVNCAFACIIAGGIGYYLASRKYARIIAQMMFRGSVVLDRDSESSSTTKH